MSVLLTILLTRRECCCWLGVLFCLTTGKRDKDDSPVQPGRFLNKARKKVKRTGSLMKGVLDGVRIPSPAQGM